MIKFENITVAGFEAAIKGMRNPKNSWSKSDSHPGLCGDEWTYDPGYIIGPNDKNIPRKIDKTIKNKYDIEKTFHNEVPR